MTGGEARSESFLSSGHTRRQAAEELRGFSARVLSRPMSTLQSQLDSLARSFAEQIVHAIRGASIHELSSGGGATAGNGRSADRPTAFASSGAARRAVSKATPTPAPKAARANGRLPRRSADEIQEMLGKVIGLVKKHKGGLRAEEIRANLGMLPKEMPRILKEGVATKKLSTKGQKRATTYFAK